MRANIRSLFGKSNWIGFRPVAVRRMGNSAGCHPEHVEGALLWTGNGEIPRQARNDRWKDSEAGSVMLEFVIAFPVILVLMFACIQFAHIWIAKMVTHYAAYCAARTALVCKDTDEFQTGPSSAATLVCNNIVVDPNSDTTVTDVSGSGPTNVTARVSHTFSLIAPIVGQMIALGINPWDQTAASSGNTGSSVFPTITLTESVTLPKPYVTVVQAGF